MKRFLPILLLFVFGSSAFSQNQPPVLQNPIADQTLNSVQTFTINLNNVFRDPEGDPMDFVLQGFDNKLLDVTLVGAVLRVRAISPPEFGTGAVFVAVRLAPGQFGATDFFDVTIVNTPPVLTTLIPDRTLQKGNMVTVDFDSFFNEIDGQSIYYYVEVFDENVVQVSDNNETSTFVFTALNYGQTTVRVEAYDGYGDLPTVDEFVITVPNNPPVALGSPPDQNIEVGDEILFKVGAFFSDPDGDPLSFGVSRTNPNVTSAQILGTNVRIVGLQPGTSRITLTANDGVNPNAITSFFVTVNAAPIVISAIGTQDLWRQESRQIDLSDIFADPNEDPLFYEASSSSPGNTAVSVSGSLLTITGVSIGESTISVRAFDRDPNAGKSFNEKAEAMLTFLSRVINRPPTLISGIPDVTLPTNGSQVVNLGLYFSDLDSDVLSFTAVSANAAVVTTSISGTQLTVLAAGSGITTVSVTANDGYGGTVNDVFTVTVNLRPVVNRPVSAISMSFPGTEAIREINLDGPPPVFIDPEATTMTYMATSGNRNVARASVTGSIVRIEAVGVGSAIITLRATDMGGASATSGFSVTVRLDTPPTLTADFPQEATFGTEYPVAVAAADDRGIDAARFLFRKVTDPTFTSIPMTLTSGTNVSGTWSATIPAGSVNEVPMEVFVEVDDAFSAHPGTTTPRIAVPVRIPDATLSIPPDRFTEGAEETDYRIISIPYLLDERDGETTLSRGLGAFFPYRWRLNQWAGSEGGSYLDLENGPINLDPGHGFWLLTRGMPRELPVLGEGVTLDGVTPFERTIPAGWSLIGNPFTFPVSVEQISGGTDQGGFDVVAYDGSYSPTATLLPFHGYFVANNSGTSQLLQIYPDQTGSGTRADISKSSSEQGWQASVSLTKNGMDVDADNVFGVHPDASDEWDKFDRPEPPAFASALSLAFPGNFAGRPISRYRSDFRPLGNTLTSWRIEVSGSSVEPVSLSFSNLLSLPGDVALELYDPVSGVRQNLSENPSYTLPGITAKRYIEIFAGSKEALRKNAENEIPSVTGLNSVYPNPARTSVQFQYDLAEETPVSVTVFDVLGRIVAVPVDNEVQPAGRKTILFNPVEGLPSGAYFVRFQTPTVIQTQKWILVK